MFDITSSKLLILGLLALVVVGPKELPLLLRTLGKYMGLIRRHANEFRAQFDQAMREAELESIKKDIEEAASSAKSTFTDAQSSVDRELNAAAHDLNHSIKAPETQANMVPETPVPFDPPAVAYDPLNGNGDGLVSSETAVPAPMADTAAPEEPAGASVVAPPAQLAEAGKSAPAGDGGTADHLAKAAG